MRAARVSAVAIELIEKGGISGSAALPIGRPRK